MITLYAIKHIPTGHFLPDVKGRRGVGFTHVEPVLATPATPPRLFHASTAAKIALTYWLKGKITVYCHQAYDGDFDEIWNTLPVPTRQRTEMAIIPISLVEEAV